MGLIQREIETQGIPTVGISIVKEYSAKVKPPRTVFLRWPFGHPLGEPDQPLQQRAVLLVALGLLVHGKEPGAIVEPPFVWRRHRYTEAELGDIPIAPAQREP